MSDQSIDITNIEYSVSKSINFQWKFTTSSNSWNASSKEFLLKEISSACSLSTKGNYYNVNYSAYHNVYMAITFANHHLMLESIDVILFHKASNRKFLFYLTKEIGNPNVFSTNKTIYLVSQFNELNQDWNITIVYENNPTYQNKLENDLKELLESEKYADFHIKAQDVTFKVHKGILSCRCNVLAKALESDMIEKQNSELQLNMWDPAVLKEFLLFLYTGSCDLSLNPHQLFELANYYQFDELKSKCTIYLQDNMNVKNVVHTLELTDEEQYNLKDLQTFAHSFVKKNETSLAKDIDFQDYLSKSMKINNLVFILSLAYTHNLDGPLERGKEFIKQNYNEVLKNEECRRYLSLQGELLLDILQYSLDSTLKI